MILRNMELPRKRVTKHNGTMTMNFFLSLIKMRLKNLSKRQTSLQVFLIRESSTFFLSSTFSRKSKPIVMRDMKLPLLIRIKSSKKRRKNGPRLPNLLLESQIMRKQTDTIMLLNL